MNRSKWAAVLWLVAAAAGVVVTVAFRTDQLQWALTISGAVAAAVVGLLLFWRPIRGIVTWSAAVGVAWIVIYAWLTYMQRGELAAWTTDVFLGALGVVAAALSLKRAAALDSVIARSLAGVVGLLYVVPGVWALFAPAAFYSSVANFAPYNLHLLHDVGAFQLGIGAALLAAAATDRGLAPTLLGAVVASLAHLVSHLLDIRLGGHPATDLPALALIVVGLATALVMELRKRRTRA